jgi:hypothetical protein
VLESQSAKEDPTCVSWILIPADNCSKMHNKHRQFERLTVKKPKEEKGNQILWCADPNMIA